MNLCHKWIGQAGVNNSLLTDVEIPLPPLGEQERILAELESCRKEIDNHKQQIGELEKEIQNRVASIWGQDIERSDKDRRASEN